MRDYAAYSVDERAPLLRAFVDAFHRSVDARQAVLRADDELTVSNVHAEALAEQLGAITRRLAREAIAWTGAAGEEEIADTQYAFVALLDELLLFSEWPGRAAWESKPLEMRIFGTRAAGERLPDAIEALLARRDASQRDLANVYLACLMLGFRGRLRDQAGALRHDQLRHALFAFAMQRDAEPGRLAGPLERNGLAQRSATPLAHMFPDNARFVGLLGIGVCVLLGISHLLWFSATASVRPALEQFQAVALADDTPAQAYGASSTGVVQPPVVKRRTRAHGASGADAMTTATRASASGAAGPLPVAPSYLAERDAAQAAGARP
jgi:type VI secretion system protein ImpK